MTIEHTEEQIIKAIVELTALHRKVDTIRDSESLESKWNSDEDMLMYFIKSLETIYDPLYISMSSIVKYCYMVSEYNTQLYLIKKEIDNTIVNMLTMLEISDPTP